MTGSTKYGANLQGEGRGGSGGKEVGRHYSATEEHGGVNITHTYIPANI